MRSAGDLTNHHRHLNWLHWQNYGIGRKNADNVEQDEALESESRQTQTVTPKREEVGNYVIPKTHLQLRIDARDMLNLAVVRQKELLL